MCSVALSVVTYNANIRLLAETLDLCKSLGFTVYLFDNGSKNYSQLIRTTKSYSNVIILTTKKNMGIAYALNEIFKLGIKKYDWIITLDQDSKITKDFLCDYLKYLKKFNKQTDVALLCPRIVDRSVNKVIFGSSLEFEKINDAENVITSGSCIKASCWEKIGGFYNDLFIDFVDTDFQERLLLSNYKIIRCNKIVLSHKIGNAWDFRIGPFVIRCSNHSSFRRYFMVRNRLYFYKKYKITLEFYKAWIRLAFGTLKICLFEKEKIAKTKAFFKGWKDYRNL